MNPKVRINTLTQLDVLVAITICGYQWRIIPAFDGNNIALLQHKDEVLTGDDFRHIASWDVLIANHWTPNREFKTWQLSWDFPSFSTDMGIAWNMAMSAPRQSFYLTEMSSVSLWRCNMLSMPHNNVDAATPEIAICLAVLRTSNIYYNRDFEFGEVLKPLIERSVGIRKIDVTELQ
jgi:hypothetical protein